MRAAILVGLVLVAAACGPAQAVASPSPAGTASPTPVASEISSLPPVGCARSVPATGPLVLTAPDVTRSTVTVDSLADPSKPQRICAFDRVSPSNVHFISRTEVSLVTQDNSIVRVNLATGERRVVARLGGVHGWSPDGRSLAYLTFGSDPSSGFNVPELHLVTDAGDRLLSKMPAPFGGRDGSFEDTLFVSFSQDGSYFALVQTLSGGEGEQSQFQVRRADGSLVAAGDGPSRLMRGHAVWVGGDLYFRHLGTADVIRLQLPSTVTVA